MVFDAVELKKYFGVSLVPHNGLLESLARLLPALNQRWR